MFKDHPWHKENLAAPAHLSLLSPSPNDIRASATVCVFGRQEKKCSPGSIKQQNPEQKHLFMFIIQSVFCFSKTGNFFFSSPLHLITVQIQDWTEPRGPEKLATVQLLLPLKHPTTADAATPTHTHTTTHTDNVWDTPKDICPGLRASHTTSTSTDGDIWISALNSLPPPSPPSTRDVQTRLNLNSY